MLCNKHNVSTLIFKVSILLHNRRIKVITKCMLAQLHRHKDVANFQELAFVIKQLKANLSFLLSETMAGLQCQAIKNKNRNHLIN